MEGEFDVAETSIALEGPDEPKQQSRSKPPFGERKKAKGPLMSPIKKEDGGRAVARHNVRLWKASDKPIEKASCQWRVNSARRQGVVNAKVRWNSDDDHWTAFLPRNASPDTVPDVNKAADLCRRMTSHLFVDPYIPELVIPEGDEDAESKAEMSERVLHDLQSEHGLNTALKARRATDRSHVFGSGYVRYIVNSRGQSRPVKVQARSDAEHYDLAFVDPLTGKEGPERRPVMDPNTGQPAIDPATGQPQMEELPFVEKYVLDDGTLTDDPTDALIEWIPKLESEVLDSRHIRLLPHTAPDIWEAKGVQIAAMVTWGDLKERIPGIEDELGDDRIRKILSYRPKYADDLIPGGEKADVDMMLEGQSEDDGDGEKRSKVRWNPERLALVLSTYYTQCDDYPEGLYLITLGDQYVAHRSTWQDESEPGNPKKLDLPLSQFAGFEEGREGYWHVGLMEILGGGNEIRAAQLAGWLDHLDRLNRRKIFLPTNSIINPDQLLQPRSSVIPMNPGGKPEYEDIPPWSSDSVGLYHEMGNAMEGAAGLQIQDSTNTSNIKSGRHKFAEISQMHAGLAEPRHNVERGFVRCSRIELQLARAFFDEEQEMKFVSDSGRFRHTAWKSADLVENADVRIKAGSGTMLAPAAKAQLAERYAGMGAMSPDRLREVLTSNIGGTIGLQDEPHRLRIRGQIAAFMEGPPEGWQPPPPPPPQPPQIDPVTGQPLPPPPPPLAPELQRIFEPTPADVLPENAMMRIRQISDAMADAKYLRLPPQWRMGLDMEFQRMGEAMQAAQPQQGPVNPDEDTMEGEPVNQDGSELNDLQEDALQEGAPPEMVL